MGNKNSVRGKKAIANEIATNALSDQGEHGVGSSFEKESPKESPSLVNGDAPCEPCEDKNKNPSTKLISPTSELVKAMYTVASENKIG